MIENRHVADVTGVPKGIRGGLSLCCSGGRGEVVCRNGRIGQYSHNGHNGSNGSIRILRTSHRERQYRGGWQGEHCLRGYAVLSVQRQPSAIPPMVNGKEMEHEKFPTCHTQGVGIPAQKLAEKSRAKRHGEAMVLGCYNQDHDMDHRTPVVQKSFQPLSLIQLSEEDYSL